ncbi:uncharacterized protein LOC121757365 isoform X1 [Salvia splendens]|uniref:uncharacterized protein LOC121757365 isoform X1 n=1 Tax=Salvia splendens TaxID=180675 RepID=UPI0011045BF9|nr:uncharacterized protein LOC121757365 isoform X1 [Salvia splendens]
MCEMAMAMAMATATAKEETDNEEEEALYQYHYGYGIGSSLSLVQSPSTISHAPNSNRLTRTHSSSQSQATNKYSQKFDVDIHENTNWTKYLSLSYSNSGAWILMQLAWRFLLSFVIAMLVFYVAAKPPHPHVSLQVAGIRQFRLGEGVDASGVTTKLLSCNFSINLIIDNHSNLFALHIHPLIIKLIFGRLTFAISQTQGRELYAGSDDLTVLRFNIGTKNKAMYGAGRSMQDFLESEKGLPLVIRVSLRSKFNVVWGILETKYHHEAQCLVVLDDSYDKKHKTQVYNTTCHVINS